MICRAIPYEGREPYIFFSYCHKDAQRVYPLLEQLVRDGYRVWYDDGNHPGDDWLENVAGHLDGCGVCLAMISENSAASHNCRSEVSFAIEREKKLMAVLLEEFQMSLGMSLQLGMIHYLKKSEYPSDHMLLQKLYEAGEMKACQAKPGSLPMRDIPEEKKAAGFKTEIVKLEEPSPEPEPETEPEPKKKVVIKVKPKAKQEAVKREKADIPDEIPEAEEPQQPEIAEAPVIPAEPVPEEKQGEQIPQEAEQVSSEENEELTVYPEQNEEKTIYGTSNLSDEDEERTMRAAQNQTIVLVRTSRSEGYVLDTALVEIGRSKKRDVVLDDNEWISGHHADIVQYKGCCYLRDHNSSNGTFIGSERLEADGQVQLQSPAVFRLYDEMFIFFSGTEAKKLALQKQVCLLRNVQTQELRLLEEETLPLDRSHIWENGTFRRDVGISRRPHAAVSRNQDGIFLEDKGNPNGVYLNGRKLAAHESCSVKSGDQIRLGMTTLEVCIAAL